MEHNTVPRLPAELEKYIFELTANTADPKIILKLILIARKTKIWLEPMLYSNLRMTDLRTVQNIAKFPRPFVQTIQIGDYGSSLYGIPNETLCRLGEACSNLRKLSLHEAPKEFSTETASLFPKLELLAVDFTSNFGHGISTRPSQTIHPPPPIFHNLTHLYCGWIAPWVPPSQAHMRFDYVAVPIGIFPALTHLALQANNVGSTKALDDSSAINSNIYDGTSAWLQVVLTLRLVILKFDEVLEDCDTLLDQFQSTHPVKDRDPRIVCLKKSHLFPRKYEEKWFESLDTLWRLGEAIHERQAAERD